MKYKVLVLMMAFSFLISCSDDNTTNHNFTNQIVTVEIGTQIWMKRNLVVEHYRNGDVIPQVTDKREWEKLTTGAWCYYNNDPAMGSVYGKLYNWFAVNDPRGLAPEGWHIPSDSEWTKLTDYLGDSWFVGNQLKEAGLNHWSKTNKAIKDEIGFTALPSGYRNYDGSYYNIREYTFWWSSTKYDSTRAITRCITSFGTDIPNDSSLFRNGFSVRCVKD